VTYAFFTYSMFSGVVAKGNPKDDRELFDGAYYISPELPKDYMLELIEALGARENYTVQVNKPYAELR